MTLQARLIHKYASIRVLAKKQIRIHDDLTRFIGERLASKARQRAPLPATMRIQSLTDEAITPWGTG